VSLQGIVPDANPKVSPYLYAMIGDSCLVVDPTTRPVIYVVDGPV